MLPLALPVAMSAIKALVKFRGRVDDILATRAATADLPYLLPPAPANDAPHIENMRRFFRSDAGRLVLELDAKTAMFENYDADPDGPVQGDRMRLCKLYYQAVDVQPDPIGPGEPTPDRGPSSDERLAYYLVSSHRLSRNPALTRILLATADTLLEVAGENAGLFVSNPRLRPIVETLLQEFAGKVDFDDSAAQDIFKQLIAAAVTSAVENAGGISEHPAFSALVGALAEAQKEAGADFVTGLLTGDGFLKLSGLFLTHVADHPEFVTKHPVAQEAFGAMLKEAGKNLPRLKSDPAALLGALQAGLVVGSAHAPELLGPQVAGKPLLAELLVVVSEKVTQLGNHNLLFQETAKGEIFGAIYDTVLRAVVLDAARLLDPATMKPWVADLVAGSVEIVGRQGLKALTSTETLEELGVRALGTLAKHPELLVKDHRAASKILGDVLEAAAASLKDGFTVDDLVQIGDRAVRLAAEQGAFRKLPEVPKELLAALSAVDLKDLLSAEGRKAVLLGGLDAVARNPKTWEALRAGDLLRPLAEALLDGLRADPSGLLSGPTLTDAASRVLVVVARRGQIVVDKKVKPEVLKEFLAEALALAEDELGYGLDAETLPSFVEGMLERFLRAPFKVAEVAKMKKLLAATLKALQPA